MGGASQSVFGSSSVDILTKITRGAAISFITLALILSFLFSKKEEKLPITQEEPILSPAPEENKENKPAENKPAGTPTETPKPAETPKP